MAETVDRAFIAAVNELTAARKALQAAERMTCRIAAMRKMISTGQACLQHAQEARELVADARRHLDLYEAALTRLAEGVGRRAVV